MKEQEARVGLFPLVQPAATKAAVNPFAFSEAGARGFVPPTPAVDLDLSATSGAVTDRGAAHLPVTITGKTAPFSERGGAVTGLRMYGEDANRSYLSLPTEPMSKLLAGKDFTICMWVKPMLDKETLGDLVQWGLAMDWGITEKGTSVIINDQAETQMAAEDILTPRRWHFLAITAKGEKTTLFIDGLNVADRTWEAPVGEGRAPFVIGGTLRSEQSLNMKLASFAIYSQALDDNDVGKLYLRDKSRYESTADKAWPEDYYTRFDFTPAGVTDRAEFPAQLKPGAGTTVKVTDGRAVLDFDGKASSLLVQENPNIHLLSGAFSMIMDINPAPGINGCLFRRYHDIGLWLRKDGSLMLDANIGHQNQLVFPGAVVAGQWNRLMLTYDGETATVFRDGVLVGRKAYPGSLSVHWDFSLSVGADNTSVKPPFVDYTPMQMREFAIYPRVLDAMPGW